MDLDVSDAEGPCVEFDRWVGEPVAMAGELELRTELDPAGWTVRLAGVMSGAGARALCERLREIASRGRRQITLDVRDVRELTDFGAAILSHGLRCEAVLKRAVWLREPPAALRRQLDRFGMGAGPM